ncbi:MAG TPA: DUF302 domain-containing protein [Acidimicrobiales bacterium]|nr:DUF302 domain-containing protein [Acidimicrobiales bacterium]
MPDKPNDDFDAVTKLSPHSVGVTVEKLLELLRSKDIKIFAVIDQRAEARHIGLNLRETTLVIFGNPMAGTPVMEAVPLAALDLPLKILVWADGDETKVTYVAPEALAVRYHLAPDLQGRLAGIHDLVNALVSN